jgi:hypothetical protein
MQTKYVVALSFGCALAAAVIYLAATIVLGVQLSILPILGMLAGAGAIILLFSFIKNVLVKK